MQKNLIVRKAVNLSGGYDIKGKSVEGFLTRPGDILVFDAQNANNLTIYRNEEIAKVLPHQSTISIEALVKGGFFEEVKVTQPAPKPAPVVIPTPAPVAPPQAAAKPKPVAPKPAPKAAEKPAEKPTPTLDDVEDTTI